MKILYKIYKISQINPKHTAISSNKKISYGVLWQLASNLAFFLNKKKIKKICILQNENDDFICYVSMIASLMSGATYIPINSSTPLNRLKFIIESTKANLLISNKKPIGNFECKILSTKDVLKLKTIKNFKIKKSKKDAYIIFTSGSTGKPKGVRISRESMDHYILWIIKSFFNDKVIRCSQHPGIGFDLSVADIFGTLSGGGTLFPIQNTYDKLFLNKFINKNKLSHWISVPSAVDLIFDGNYLKKNDVKSLKKMFFCGEVLKKIHLQKIFKYNKNIKVINSYGPTEATVSCTSIKLNSKNFLNFCKPTVSFGKPIENMKIGFVEKNKKSQGEIFISGPQISEGYIQENLNVKKFKNIKNKKSFITGDICRIVRGNFYFLNRIDRQVKILGNRIELDEIDRVIGDLTSNTAHSIIYKNKIYSFFIGKNLKNNLNIKLNKYLPKYMLPNKIIKIKKLPKNKNLKIDEKKLIKLL